MSFFFQNINQDFADGTTIENESIVTELPEKVNKMREIKFPSNINKYFRFNRAAVDKNIKSIKTLDYSRIETDDKLEISIKISTPISITSTEFRDNEMTRLQLENQESTTITTVTNENIFEIKSLVDNSILSSTSGSKKAGNPQLLRSNEAVDYSEQSQSNFETAIISNSDGNSSNIEKLGKSLNENDEDLSTGRVVPLFQANSSGGNYYKLRSSEVGVVQVRMQNTSVSDDGSTRLIYSVHLGGKPVPAETAAKDMALLSPQEVALELGAPVIIQSERNKRQPDYLLIFPSS